MVRRRVALLTLTRFPDIFHRLADSLDTHEDRNLRRVVVTSGGATIHRDPWEVVTGVEPFVFARNVNRGLAHIGPDTDVLLVNDDCEWIGPILSALSAYCQHTPECGLLSPLIDGGVGNPDQRARRGSPHVVMTTEHALCFVCVYLPASTLAAVGPLDERFTGYGGEDVDYTERVRHAGLGCRVMTSVTVRHGYGASVPDSASFRRVLTPQQQYDSMRAMDTLLLDKHAHRVCVIVPSGPVPRTHGFEWSLAALQLPPGSVKFRPPGKSAARNRNVGIAEAPGNITHFFFVDDDHWFAPDTVLRLLAHRQPVVCALTWASAPPWTPLVCKAVTMVHGQPSHEWYAWKELAGHTGLLEVPAAAGSGLLLHKDVLARLTPPWFDYLHGAEGLGEDMFLYAAIRQLTEPRIPIYVDLETRLHHFDTAESGAFRADDGTWRMRVTWPNGASVVVDPAREETR